MADRDVGYGRGSVVLRCLRCAALAYPGSNFCAQCGWSLSDEPPEAAASLGRGPDRRGHSRLGSPFERRQLTVVFCDLVDSTALATRADPEDLNDAIEDFYRVVSQSVSEFGGHVARYIGDGALVYFGYPQAHEDDAERAVHASLATIARLNERRLAGLASLHIRIGVATGVVVVGNLHSAVTPGAPDIAGEAAHIAARLQAMARPDTVLVDASTHRMLGDLFEWERLGLHPLKGVPGPVNVWRVLDSKKVASRFEAQHGVSGTPMLDRDDFRTTLLDRWRDAIVGNGAAVLISGDAGIGKSRLAASVADDVGKDSAQILRFACAPHRQGSTLYPFIAYLERAAGFERGDSEETRLRKLGDILLDASAEEFALLAELLTLRHGRDVLPSTLSAQSKRNRTMHALLFQIERAARKQPALVIFEDAHWSDDTSRLLLEQGLARLARIPVLVLVLARPEFQPPWSKEARVTHMQLAPLTPGMSAALVHIVAGGHSLQPRLVAEIVDRTDGLPLFIEEVTKAIVESEVLGRASDRGSAEKEGLPFSLQTSLLARLDRLGRAREIAQLASAIGREFSSDLLRLLADPEDDLDVLLENLVASGILLRRGPSHYMFKHALIRDAAHAIMIRDKRHAIHTRIAAALEQHDPGMAEKHPEVLAWHYTEARVIDKAVGHWLRAGLLALRRSAMTEALGHLRHGEALIAQVEDSPWRRQCELDLTIAIGMGQIATQGYAVASTGETFQKAQRLCALLPDPPQTLAVMHGLWTHALLRADFPKAQSLADQVFERGENRPDPTWSLMGRRFRGVTHYPLGQFPQAVAQLESGLALYDPSRRTMYAALTVDDPRVVMLTYQSWSLMCMGRFADARKCSDIAISEAQHMGHIYTLAHALNGGAFVTLTIGSPSDALRRLDELTVVLADNGIAYYQAVATILRGWCIAALGRFEQALPLLVAGLATYRATGSALYLSGFLRMSAESYRRAGKVAEALPLIEEAITVMNATGQCWDAAEIHRVHGTILRALDEKEVAESAFRRALDIARRQHALLWELRAARDLAALLTARGANDEAGSLLGGVQSADRRMPADIEYAREILAAAN